MSPIPSITPLTAVARMLNVPNASSSSRDLVLAALYFMRAFFLAARFRFPRPFFRANALRLFLLRIIGAQRKRPDHRMTSYNRANEITRCESIETTLRKRRLLWVRTLIRMSGGRLPKQIVFGNLEGAMRRGQDGKDK